jgi:hypothetical protein
MFVARAVTTLLVAGAPLLMSAPASAQDVTKTTISLPATPVTYGQTATLTATVVNETAPGVAPTGSVQFFLDGAALGGPVVLVDRTASIQTSPLAVGAHPVRAEYTPNGDFVAGPTPSTTLSVGKAETTTVARVVPANGVAGQDLALEALVTSKTPAGGVPTGMVAGTIDASPISVGLLDLGGIARTTHDLGANTHTVILSYLGGPNHAPSSGIATVQIAKAGTFVVLTATPNPAAVGQLVRFDATADSFMPSLWWPSGVLSGAIDGVPVQGTVELLGRAGEGGEFTRSFSTPGTHTATVHFEGDQDFLSSDATVAVTVTGTSAYGDPFPPGVARRPLAARGLTLAATPKRDRRAPYRFTVTGTLQLPGSVAKATGCTGKVTVVAKLKAKRVARKTATVTSACTFKTAFTSSRKGSLSITAAFGGNASVSGVNARAVKVKAG